MKESDLEKDCTDLAEMMGWIRYKGAGVNGAPDSTFFKFGSGWVAEIKRNKGGVQSQSQKREQRRCKKCGVSYYLIRTLEEFKKAILIEEDKL